MSASKYFGKYRAKVEKIDDPEKRGRIRVICPKVLGTAVSNWCEPCSPFAYDLGGDMSLPKIGEFVWIEFEEGEPNKPIYVGGLWSKEKTPFINYEDAKTTRVFERDGAKITLGNGAITISLGDSKILMTKTNIVITSPRVDWNNT
jgi:phage baseplate assembly protein gpV